MPKIINKYYKEFIDGGIIQTVDEQEVLGMLPKVKGIRGQFVEEGRALVIALYYTGARPNEVLALKAHDFSREKGWVKIRFAGMLNRGRKSTLPRIIHLKFSKLMVKELYNFSLKLMPEMFMFYHYIGGYFQRSRGKKRVGDFNRIVSQVIRQRFYLWFPEKGITPYFLRHNRFSKLAMKDASDFEMVQFKGCRSAESIRPYKHLSSKMAKKLGAKID